VEEGEKQVVKGKVEEKEAPAEKKEVVVAEEEKGPQYGGTLTILTNISGIEPMSWDPADVLWKNNYDAGFYMEELILGDLQKGPRGENVFGFQTYYGIPDEALRGVLAESWEWPDPLTLIYHIRKGVNWQEKPGVMSAREMTADDVVFSLNRFLESPKLPKARYYWIDSITAPDKYTVLVKGNEYYADWGYVLGWGYYTLIYPPELVDAGIKDWHNAVGTGPFSLVDYVRGASTTYERNPNYWDKTIIDGKEYQLPFVDRVQMPIITDVSTALAALRTGKADLYNTIGWEYVESLAQTNPELVKYSWLPVSSSYVAMRMDNPELPFYDKRVRRALAMAVDNQAMLDSLCGGEGTLLNFLYHATWPETLYTPLEKLPESTRELFEYKPEEAKRLLAEAGYPDGFKTDVVVSSLGAAGDWMSMIADYWDDIGVECEMQIVDYATWTSVWYGRTHKQMLFTSTGTVTPTYGLQTHALVESTLNSAAFDDSYLRERFEEARKMLDTTEQYRIYKELQAYWLDQVPYIILPVGYSNTYAWPWVKNYYGEVQVGCYMYAPVYARIWIDQEFKKEMGY